MGIAAAFAVSFREGNTVNLFLLYSYKRGPQPGEMGGNPCTRGFVLA